MDQQNAANGFFRTTEFPNLTINEASTSLFSNVSAGSDKLIDLPLDSQDDIGAALPNTERFLTSSMMLLFALALMATGIGLRRFA